MIAKPTPTVTANPNAKSSKAIRARSAMFTGNPFQNHQISNLYPNRTSGGARDANTAPAASKLNQAGAMHDRIEKLRETSTGVAGERASLRSRKQLRIRRQVEFAKSLADGLQVTRRKYQLIAAAKIIQAFAGDEARQSGSNPVATGAASVLLRGSSESGKMIMALMVVRNLQRKLGLSVAWAANTRRLKKLREEIAQRGFDVEIQVVDVHDMHREASTVTKADLLIMDQNSMDSVQSVDFLGEHVDPQIVLGLTSGIFLKNQIRDCFDVEICCTAKPRLHAVDGAATQEKLPHMPVT